MSLQSSNAQPSTSALSALTTRVVNTITNSNGIESMTPEQFTYWLQGFTELNGAMPNEVQWKAITDHLKTVFNKVTPYRGITTLGSPSLSEYAIPATSPIHTAIC